MAHYHFFGNI